MKHLLLILFALPVVALADGGLPTQPYIYVEGTAKVEKPADIVTLRFDLIARHAEQATANKDVQAKSSKVFSLVKNAKIAEKDVIASDLRSEAEFEQKDEYQGKRGKFLDYKITRPFAVKVRHLTAFPKLVDELLAIGGLEFSSIDAGLSNEEELKDAVWEKALNDAHDRAAKTLKTAEMKIDSVFAISPVSFPQIGTAIFGESGATAAYAMEAHREIQPSEYRLPPVTVSQSIHVIYLISPAK